MDGDGGEDGSASGARFEWDEDSQLYYHASTGFYHDPVAGWYYSSRDGQYYIYDNGNYMPWTPDADWNQIYHINRMRQSGHHQNEQHFLKHNDAGSWIQDSAVMLSVSKEVPWCLMLNELHGGFCNEFGVPFLLGSPERNVKKNKMAI
ncbi:hypothetical protein E2562_024995 [Oryza meyeriana var. granulata]|uniref:OCRE domain-containing protein n=1 Tax=Oryza meyeriana var. granulata TaxID=110450 RepID=A0A6G1FBP0_9ORYZ|nr:hypothetical protein E2562_024995 [Oryza meyeriana var. granulata]